MAISNYTELARVSSTSSGQTSFTVSGTVPANAMAVVGVVAANTTTTVGDPSSVQDNAGTPNSYTKAAGFTRNTNVSTSMWYFLDVTGGSRVVTVTLPAAANMTFGYFGYITNCSGFDVVNSTGISGLASPTVVTATPNSGNVSIADSLAVILTGWTLGVAATTWPPTNYSVTGLTGSGQNNSSLRSRSSAIAFRNGLTAGATETASGFTYSGTTDSAFVLGVFKGVVNQKSRPSSMVTRGSWKDNTGSTTGANLVAAINEATIDDATYIQSALSPGSTADVSEFAFQSLTDPLVSTNHTIRYRYKKDQTAGDTINLTVRLMQGATEIASWTHNNIDAVTTAAQTLTSGQADSITDYTNLRLKFEATSA
jgi:hypothetical protein